MYRSNLETKAIAQFAQGIDRLKDLYRNGCLPVVSVTKLLSQKRQFFPIQFQVGFQKPVILQKNRKRNNNF